MTTIVFTHVAFAHYFWVQKAAKHGQTEMGIRGRKSSSFVVIQGCTPQKAKAEAMASATMANTPVEEAAEVDLSVSFGSLGESSVSSSLQSSVQ